MDVWPKTKIGLLNKVRSVIYVLKAVLKAVLKYVDNNSKTFLPQRFFLMEEESLTLNIHECDVLLVNVFKQLLTEAYKEYIFICCICIIYRFLHLEGRYN
jgi:hypothetical protein